MSATNASKCLHGNSENEGINKDTTSTCFSTHADLHDKAATLAESATLQYLEHVRMTLQNDKFMSLLDLSFGSALAIVLDYSGSMSDEIEAVKNQIVQIIDEANAGGVRPSVYILAPFDSTVDLTVTKDEDVVKEVLAGITADGSGTENVFSALQVKQISKD